MKFQPGVAWELACKDWKLFLADRQGALLCFAVPILLGSAFGAIFHHSARDVVQPRLPILLVDEDQSPFSRGVAETLRQGEQAEVRECDRVEALGQLERRSGGVVVVLPKGLGELGRTPTPRKTTQPSVQVYSYPGGACEGRWAEGLLTEAVMRQAARTWVSGLAGAPEATFERPFVVEHQIPPGAVAVNSYSHSFCGMTLQYLLFWGMDSGLLLLRERRRGIWRRQRAAPVSLATLLAGKVLSTATIALLQIALTFAFAGLVFGVRIGSLAGFLILALAAALLSAATGLLVAALGGNEARARSLSIVVILTLSLLGGMWLPSFLLPGWVQDLSVALPTTWAVRGFAGATWRGVGLSGLLPCTLALTGFSVAFLAVALWRFRATEAQLVIKGE